MNTADEVYQKLKVAPEELVLEVRDFLEFLIQKHKKTDVVAHDLASFVGLLKDSPSFEGDPLTIQRKMRDEWS